MLVYDLDKFEMIQKIEGVANRRGINHWYESSRFADDQVILAWFHDAYRGT